MLETLSDRSELLNEQESAPRVPGAVVTGLWIGACLPPLGELCIRSFQDHGFSFRLFTYGKVTNVPDGTLIEDASQVLPGDDVFIHAETGSLAPASDWFRYRFLAEHGGAWTDMDVVCLKPFRAEPMPWFALQEAGIAAIGFLAFPQNHVIPTLLAELAADPASRMPWDNSRELQRKMSLRRRWPDIADRRIRATWSTTGPHGFTLAVKHFKLWSSAASSASIYPVHYSEWKSLFNRSLGLSDPRFSDSWAVHLWGEMLRREPDVLRKLSPDSVVAELMARHGVENPDSVLRKSSSRRPAPRILIGICSCAKHADKREAVRETWLAKAVDGIDYRFFIGGSPIPEEPDVIAVQVDDSYEFLPEKVRTFFREALRISDFEWLFKCDDDTYVALDRLAELIDYEHEFIGNEFIEQRGSPSGGAGYLLSRRIVQSLADDHALPAKGAEDVILGKAAIKLGARAKGTTRLCWNSSRYPAHDNDTVTSHWCSPDQMKMITAMLNEELSRRISAIHNCWEDDIILYPNGLFRRTSTACSGNWRELPNGALELKWSGWPLEVLVPDEASAPRYRAISAKEWKQSQKNLMPSL